jgi:hypothetical protein
VTCLGGASGSEVGALHVLIAVARDPFKESRRLPAWTVFEACGSVIRISATTVIKTWKARYSRYPVAANGVVTIIRTPPFQASIRSHRIAQLFQCRSQAPESHLLRRAEIMFERDAHDQRFELSFDPCGVSDELAASIVNCGARRLA